tara:strand:- start:53 stop:223 length:171 start_codon:yes stop_codon:yes gene_type:complete
MDFEICEGGGQDQASDQIAKIGFRVEVQNTPFLRMVSRQDQIGKSDFELKSKKERF